MVARSVDTDDLASLGELFHLSREVERRASVAGLSVRFEEGIPSAATNGSTIIFPKFQAPLTKRDLILLKHMSIHEPLHINRPKLFSLIKNEKIPISSPLGQIINAVEDEIMEHEHSLRYAGDAADLALGHNTVYGEVSEHLGKRGVELDPKGTTIITVTSIMAAAKTFGRMTYENGKLWVAGGYVNALS